MGLLSIPIERIRLSRLRRKLSREPLPHGFAEAARGYLAIGDLDQARIVLEDGIRLFPEADELTKALTFLITRDREAEFIAAKERVRAQPTLQSYLALADAYAALGRTEPCLATLREAIDRFEDSSTPLLKLADLRYARFLAGCAAADGEAAEQLYRRAVEREPEALKPHFLLAQYYCRIGARVHALAEVAKLLELSPEHERGLVLKDLLVKSAPAEGNGVIEDVTSLVQAVEERRRFVVDSFPWEEHSEDAPLAPIADPANEVDRLATQAGTRRAVLVDGHGREYFAAGASDPRLASAVVDLAAMCNRAARGMQLGPPLRLEVVGDDGMFMIEMKRDVAAGLALESHSDFEAAATAARDAIERMVRT